MPPDAGGRGRKSSCLQEEPLILSRCERTAAIHCLGGSHRNRTPFLRNYQDHTGVIQYHLRKWTQLSLMLQMRKYIFVHTCCRSPHGERGLKFLPLYALCIAKGRTQEGECGLKEVYGVCLVYAACLAPNGVRGLKYFAMLDSLYNLSSLPTRGAWIEILRLS